jgi:hypothetical protein
VGWNSLAELAVSLAVSLAVLICLHLEKNNSLDVFQLKQNCVFFLEEEEEEK